ncbi:MAG: DMT family transporter [Actinobacteria bacterium]|nr:MAG: DMT family transporter [Actinomycetota bacterium]
MTTARRPTLGLLAVAVFFISTSAPIIAATQAPALAIAFWRTALGAALTAPWTLTRHLPELRALTARQWWLCAAGGALLAAHFAAWIPSLRFTSVASSTALVATQPVWAALLARARGVRFPGRVWAGIGVALVGITVLTGVDVALDARSLIGDALALVGAMLAAAYVTVGEAARQDVSTPSYTLIAYSSSAVVLLPVCLLAGAALTGYPASAWALIAALTLLAQLLGHSLINATLRTTSATVTSMGILFEMPIATILAALFLGQWPPLAVVPALVLLLVGVAIVVRAGAGSTPSATLAESPT